jgi:hypothetical protein
MLNPVPGGIARPLIAIASDPSARVNGRSSWPILPGAPGVERQKVNGTCSMASGYPNLD